jgi:hypothetical protein
MDVETPDELEGETDPQARVAKMSGDEEGAEWDPEARLREPEARVHKEAGDEESGEWDPEARVSKMGGDEGNPDEADLRVKWGEEEGA